MFCLSVCLSVKCGCSNYFFLNSANLICRGTDISKYFRESLGIRDNERRLYNTEKHKDSHYAVSLTWCLHHYLAGIIPVI